MLGPGYRFSLLSDEALCSSCAGVPRIIRKLLWQQRSGTMRMGPQTETVEFPSSFEIFREKYRTAGLLGSATDERVREREAVQPLEDR